MAVFNITLFLCFSLYITSMFVGFSIKKDNKKKHYKNLHKYTNFLFGLVYFLFSCVNAILLYGIFKYDSLTILIAFALHILFNCYFIFDTAKSGNCDKQHFMIWYNFFSIVIVYLCSLIYNAEFINYLYIIPVMIYNIIEFQFAQFDFKKKEFWD